MLISEKHNFIFVHIQKTAGESIATVLREHIPDVMPLLNKHDFAIKGKKAIGKEQWTKYYKFAFVRNPYDRLVSWYSMAVNMGPRNRLWEYMLKNSRNFEEFIKNCTQTIHDYDGEKNCFYNQLRYLTDEEGNMIVDFVGRYENLKEDFKKICGIIDLPQVKLPHIRHKSKHTHYSAYYTPEMREIVAQRYAKDIEFFGYQFEIPDSSVGYRVMKRKIWKSWAFRAERAIESLKRDMSIFRDFLNYEKWRRLYLSIRYRFIVPRYDGMMDERKCRFLYDTVMKYRGKKALIVEIGSYMGCSTTWLAVAGMRNGFQSLIAIDLFTGTPSWNQKFDTYKTFMLRIKSNKLETFVKPIRGNSGDVIKQWEDKNKIAILHIDGDHSYEGVKADMNNYIPYLEQNGIVIFDDYDSEHPDVRRAVHELLNTGSFQIVNIVEEIRKGYGSIALQKTSAISYATKNTQAAPGSASIKGVLK